MKTIEKKQLADYPQIFLIAEVNFMGMLILLIS